MDSRSGNLGSDILRRFKTVFDYSRAQMILVPNSAFSEPFDWDRSGLRLGLGKALSVNSILAGSPAETAGVMEGDLLLRLDGKSVSAADYGTVKDALMGSGEVRLTLQRGDEILEKTVTLRRLI
jgi:C-terminal processing protease CtpA/Prc